VQPDALGALSNRESAALIWATALLLSCVAVPKMRQSMGPHLLLFLGVSSNGVCWSSSDCS
jgi:hypothetical protein